MRVLTVKFTVILGVLWISAFGSNGQHITPTDSLRILFQNLHSVEAKGAFLSKVDIELVMSHPVSFVDLGNQFLKGQMSEVEVGVYPHVNLRMGVAFISSGWMDSALYHLVKAKREFDNTADWQNRIETDNFISIAFLRSQNFDAAESIAEKGLALSKEVGNLEGILLFNRSLGWIAHERGDRSAAKRYYSYVLQRVNEAQLPAFRKANILTRIGYFYISENPELATRCFNEALAYSQRIGFLPGVEDAKLGLARVLIEQESLAPAELLLWEIANAPNSERNFATRAESCYHLADINFRRNNYHRALQLLDQSNTLAREVRRQRLLNTSLELTIQKAQGNVGAVSNLAKRQQELSAHVSKENVESLLNSIEYQLELEQAQLQVALHKSELSRGRSILALMAVLMIAILVIAFLIYHRYRLKNRVAIKLARLNGILEIRQKELSDSHRQLTEAHQTIAIQNNQLTAINESQEAALRKKTTDLRVAVMNLRRWKGDMESLVYKVSHDIRGPIARLIGLASVGKMETKDSAALEYLDKITEMANHLNNILSRLQKVSQYNAKSIKSSRIELRALVEEVFADALVQYPGAQVSLVNACGKDFEVITDQSLLRQILFILIDNSVKYRNQTPDFFSFVKVVAHTDESHVIIRVLDNGVGIDQSNRHLLFKPFSRLNKNSDVGLNLYSAKLMAEKISASLTFAKNKEGFTEFKIIAPLVESEKEIAV